MSTSLARARGEFTVWRRVPWESDDGLRPHIDRVVDALRAHDVSAEIEIDADLREAQVSLTLVVVVGDDATGEAVARTLIAEAIRRCGGRHDGLFAEADEARMETRLRIKTGLKTAKWSLHHLECERFEEDGT